MKKRATATSVKKASTKGRITYGVKMDLLLAADAGDVELVRRLMRAPKASADQLFRHPKFNRRCTALHYASRSGHLDLVQVLVEEFGANVDAKEKEDWTPVYYAANNGHTEIAEYLIGKGADVTIRDNFNGRSPLEVAQYRQFHDLVRLLSDAEARRSASASTTSAAATATISASAASKESEDDDEQAAGEEEGGEEEEEEAGEAAEPGYVRQQGQIDKEGCRPVFSGVHRKHMDLFLGRYRIPQEAPDLIEAFRRSSKRDDISYAAFDTVLNVPVTMRHCHDRERHAADANRRRGAGEVVMRSSVLSTNEFLLVVADL